MKIFFVGDFLTDTGPGIANKMLKKGLDTYDNIYFSMCKRKISRVFEMLIKIIKSDCVCFCSPSKSNIIGIKIAKLFNKKTLYLMHGYLTYEKKINEEVKEKSNIQKINQFEKFIFSNVNQVFCVSKKFMEFMIEAEPDYRNKFNYNFNGLDIDKIYQTANKFKNKKKRNQIVSLGGGMRRKNNLKVCKAIDKLNKEKGMNLKYIVIGLPYTDKEKICSYNFVKYYEQLPHESVLEILAESNIYIQNSSFETFGLAVIEALAAGCNLLVSNNVGALDVIDTLNENDIIINTNDENEIATKIEKIIYENNMERLTLGLNKDKVHYMKSAENLLNKISIYVEES